MTNLLRATLGLAGLAMLTAPPLPAQPPPTNPLTGVNQPGSPGYNPFLGGQEKIVNPFTGKANPGGGPTNPLTGKPHSGPGAARADLTWAAHDIPVIGKAGPGLDALDKVVLDIMERHGIPGASLAIAKNGKLIYAKGFGWAVLADAIPVDPATLFGLASLSKPITALAILALVDQGKLDLDDRAFDHLKHLRAIPGTRVDPRLATITIRQLLNHSGGWDRNVSGDLMNKCPQIARALKVPLPLTEDQFLTYVLTVPLDFDPGTKMAYSNVGYIMLGRIVEKATGQSYEQFIRKHVLAPAGVRAAFLSDGSGRYRKGEAHSYLAGTGSQLSPMDLRTVKAAAGWAMSAVDMTRLLTALDKSRGQGLLSDKTIQAMLDPPPAPLKAREDGTYNGLGWPTATRNAKGFGYLHDGELYGMRSFMKRTIQGVNSVALFNVNMELNQADAAQLRQALQQIHQQLDKLGHYPNVDWFGEY
jgi:N-acyl-D-amino-acid deacylase